MNKSLIVGLSVGGIMATAAGAFALRESAPKVADIVSVTPITVGMEQQYAEVMAVEEYLDPNGPRFAEVISARAIMAAGRDEEVCENIVVTHQVAPKDEHQIAGTAAGAVLGGALGNQVGGGNGKKVATATGAILGGLIGKNVQTKNQAKQTYQTTEQHCRIERGADQVTGYDVTYRLDDASNVVRLSYKPNGDLPVVNGEPTTDRAEANRIIKNRPAPRYDVFYQIDNIESSVIMPSAPEVGELLLAEYGQVITDPDRLAEIQAQQHQVIAYRVNYRLGDKAGEARMTERPSGSSLTIKDGQVVVASGSKTEPSDKAL